MSYPCDEHERSYGCFLCSSWPGCLLANGTGIMELSTKGPDQVIELLQVMIYQTGILARIAIRSPVS